MKPNILLICWHRLVRRKSCSVQEKTLQGHWVTPMIILSLKNLQRASLQTFLLSHFSKIKKGTITDHRPDFI